MADPPDRGIGVERLLAFADAVFAIAITLLTLSIDIPDRLPDDQVPAALYDVLPDLGAYVLSFVVIGSLWLAHHQVFSLIARLDHLLVRLELAFLMVIAALPVPTRIISDYGDLPIGVIVYASSMGAAGVLLAAIALRLRIRAQLRHPGVPHRVVRQSLVQASALAVVFFGSMALLAWSTSAAELCWMLTFPAHRILQRW